MKITWSWCWIGLVAILLAGCGHTVEAPGSDKLPEAADDNLEIEDTAVAFVEPTGQWRMVMVNRQNTAYLLQRNTGDEIYRAAMSFDPHLRDYHRFCDQKIILNRDMQALIGFAEQAGFFEYAIEFDPDELTRGKWSGGTAVVVEQGGKLYRMTKQPNRGSDMSEADFKRRKCYVAIKGRLLMISRNYRHYEVKNVDSTKMQPKTPLVKPKYKDQLNKPKER